ncbi:MAG: LamG domain-containing protein, partial [Myxococcales bacterium]
MTKITISTWFKVTSEPNGNPRLIDMPGYVLLTRPTGDGEAARSLQFDVLRNPNFPSWRTAAGAFAVGTWYHVAVTYDGTTYTNVPKLYINGVSQSLTQRTAPANNAQISNSGTGYIGNNSGHIRVFGGYLDDMRLYDRVLTATEISSLAIGRQPGTYVATQSMTGAPTISGDLVIASGKLTTGANNISLGGNWYNYGGIYLATGGVVTMTGTASSAIKILSAGSRFQGVIFNGSGKTFTLADNMDTDPSESIITTAGTFALSTYTLRTGDVNRNGAVTLTPNTGKLVYYTDIDHILDTGTYYDLELEPVSATNLKGYWKFDELQGDAVYDYATGASYDGAIQGTPLWTTSGATATDFDNRGALNLRGSTDFVDVPAAVVTTSSAYTACTWVKFNTGFTGYNTLLSIDGSTSTGSTMLSAFYLQRHTSGKFSMTVYPSNNTGTTSISMSGTTTPVASTWYHVCGMFDGTYIRLYVNGASEGTPLAYPTPWTATGHTILGAGKWMGLRSDYLNGSLDDVRFYNTALTTSQIA